MKEITKEAMELLEKRNVIRNTNRGFVDHRGNTIGFHRTRKRRYIEDKYVEMAERLS